MHANKYPTDKYYQYANYALTHHPNLNYKNPSKSCTLSPSPSLTILFSLIPSKTMASNPQALLVFVVFSLAVHITAARNNPKGDKLQPDLLGHSDRSVLIPGIGRVMLSPKGSHKSFHYNPITGAPRGRGVSIPRFGGPTGQYKIQSDNIVFYYKCH